MERLFPFLKIDVFILRLFGYMKIFISLIFCFCSYFCVLSQGSMTIDSLVTYNMEEDKGALEKGDEIMLCYGNYDFEKDSFLYFSYTPIMHFNDSTTIFSINDSITFDSDTSFFLTMIEVDNDISDSTLVETIKNGLHQYIHFPSNLIQEELNYVLGDDDVLFFHQYEKKEIDKLKESIVIKGMHLFNRYSYELFIQIE